MMDELIPWVVTVLGIVLGTVLLGKWWRKTNLPSEVDAAQATVSPQQTTNLLELDSGASAEANEWEAAASVSETNTPEWYLDGATRCMERVLKMTADNSSTKFKLNYTGCREYLAGKLKSAVQDSRTAYSGPFSVKHKAKCLNILELLYRLALEIEDFIQNCSRDEMWMLLTIASASVHVRVSSWGYYLELCTLLLRNEFGAVSSYTGIENLRESDCEAVDKIAADDEVSLLKTLESMTLSGISDAFRDPNFDSITVLLERLKVIHARPTAGSSKLLDSSLWKVDKKSLHRLGKLGTRVVNTMYKAKWFGRMEVAEKKVYEESDDDFKNTVSQLAKLSHPNVVSFLGYTTDEQSQSIVFELMDGDLSHLIQQRMEDVDTDREVPFSIWEATDIMIQVAEGVRHMHEKDVVPRSLEPKHILVKSSHYYNVEHVCAKVHRIPKAFPRGHYGSQVGMPHNAGVDPQKSDSYSFGLLCYLVLTGDMSFSSKRGVKVDSEKDRPALPHQYPQDLKRLIESCWDPRPSKRPSFDKICKQLRYLQCLLVAKPPEWYLDQATQCVDLAQQMNSGSHFTYQTAGSVHIEPPAMKPNLEQCKYLAGKLKSAVAKSRESLDRFSSPEHRTGCLQALKLLYQLAKEVEGFILDCCKKEAWIQAACTWASVSVRVSSLRCHLKSCTLLLRNCNKLGAAWLIFPEIERLREKELHAVREKVNADQHTLLSLLSSKSESKDRLATILLRRLKAIQAMSSDGAPHSLNVGLWRESGKRGNHPVKLLGKSTSTTVHKTKWRGAVDVAVKVFPAPSKDFSVVFKNEVSVLVKLSHPNIVTHLGFETGTTSCSAFMEVMDGDMKVLMQQKMQEDSIRESPFSIWEACDIMLQVAEGVNYIHKEGVIHGNLKSTSVLFKRSKDHDLDYVCVKVANFGLSKYKEEMLEEESFPEEMLEEEDFPELTYPRINLPAADSLKYWMAPELIRLKEGAGQSQKSDKESVLQPCSQKSDSFSFGMFCFEILTGTMPFANEGNERVRKLIKLDGARPRLPGQCPQDLKNLIKLCWDPEPNTRPSFDQICQELRYIRCSLLQGSLDSDHPCQPADAPDVPKPHILKPLPEVVTRRFKSDYSSLKVVRQLGKGGSDSVTVYVATWRQPEGAEVDAAQKTFTGSHDECFVNEVSIMAYLQHPNVVRLHCYATDTRYCAIVMELMDADLFDLITRRRRSSRPMKGNATSGPFTVDEVVAIMRQIAQGMWYIHSMNVAHRDIKSCNILVRNATEGMQVKVADFGLSVRMDPSAHSLKDSMVGTVRWMAPEVMAKESTYNPFKSDIYSFGMVCYELLAGRVPFYEIKDQTLVMEKVLVDGLRPSLPLWTPPKLTELVLKCWQKEARNRPSFANIVTELQT